MNGDERLIELPRFVREVGVIDNRSASGAQDRVGAGTLTPFDGVLGLGVSAGQWPSPALAHLTLAPLIARALGGSGGAGSPRSSTSQPTTRVPGPTSETDRSGPRLESLAPSREGAPGVESGGTTPAETQAEAVTERRVRDVLRDERTASDVAREPESGDHRSGDGEREYRASAPEESPTAAGPEPTSELPRMDVRARRTRDPTVGTDRGESGPPTDVEGRDDRGGGPADDDGVPSAAGSSEATPAGSTDAPGSADRADAGAQDRTARVSSRTADGRPIVRPIERSTDLPDLTVRAPAGDDGEAPRQATARQNRPTRARDSAEPLAAGESGTTGFDAGESASPGDSPVRAQSSTADPSARSRGATGPFDAPVSLTPLDRSREDVDRSTAGRPGASPSMPDDAVEPATDRGIRPTPSAGRDGRSHSTQDRREAASAFTTREAAQRDRHQDPTGRPDVDERALEEVIDVDRLTDRLYRAIEKKQRIERERRGL